MRNTAHNTEISRSLIFNKSCIDNLLVVGYSFLRIFLRIFLMASMTFSSTNDDDENIDEFNEQQELVLGGVAE
jgi:hypothetical protein